MSNFIYLFASLVIIFFSLLFVVKFLYKSVIKKNKKSIDLDDF